jgi:two-component system CheB/CheR fusion protein
MGDVNLAKPYLRMADARPKILIVEDSSHVRTALCSLLSDEGFEVVPSGTGGEALRLVGTTPFDMVLTDLGLPDIPGDAVIRGIRALRQGPCRIVVYSAEPELQRALRAGADAVVEKPADFDVILRALMGTAVRSAA